MKEQLVLIDADYTLKDNRGVVRLYCKNQKGKTVLVLDENFKPYFYVIPKEKKADELKKKIEPLETKNIETKILSVDVVEKIWENKKMKLIKVTIDNPRRIPDARDLIKDWKEVEETYEYDIPFAKRYIIDKQIEPMNWIEVSGEETKEKNGFEVDSVFQATSVKSLDLKKTVEFRVLAFDTEWVEEEKESKLIMLSLAANDGYKKVLTFQHWEKKPTYVEVVKDEKKIIERFVEIIKEKDPDFIVGYNSDGFDFPMLKDRATKLKVSLKVGRDNAPIFVVRRGRISSAKSKGRIHIDLFDFISHILAPSMRSEVLTLDEVAQELLGVGKKEMKYKDIIEIWRKKQQLERLAEYSMWDSELTLRLAEHVLPQVFALSKLSGQLPFDAARYTYSQLVEGFLMKKAFAHDVLIPNRPKTEDVELRREEPAYKGAIVIEPKKGIHSDILVFDFRSLYPTIIVTHNIDPWTFNFKPCKKKDEVPESKWYFCADSKGFIPKHLQELIERRKGIKSEMKKLKEGSEEFKLLDNEQYALKILANATYGYLGYFASRWFCRECASAAASWGRYYIMKVVEEAKKYGFQIIYGDTDSLFVKINEKISKGNHDE